MRIYGDTARPVSLRIPAFAGLARPHCAFVFSVLHRRRMAGAGLKTLLVVVVLVLVALVIDFNYIGSSLTEQFRFDHLSPPATGETGVADETTPTNNTTTPPPGTPLFFRSLLCLFVAFVL